MPRRWKHSSALTPSSESFFAKASRYLRITFRKRSNAWSTSPREGFLAFSLRPIEAMMSRAGVESSTAIPCSPTWVRRSLIASLVAARGVTRRTRLCFDTRAPRAFTIVWVAPVPGSARTTSEFPATMFWTMASCSPSESTMERSESAGVESGCTISIGTREVRSSTMACSFPPNASKMGCWRFLASSSMGSASSAKLEITSLAWTVTSPR